MKSFLCVAGALAFLAWLSVGMYSTAVNAGHASLIRDCEAEYSGADCVLVALPVAP